ncbi:MULTISPECIES: IclR family transcriptional regulator [unclassified Arthrobacter]|uniref:IclR family transcriptional regulator n=1 Tax=unclassified Arthrobacter TaxID=235627 RepID=UPI001490BEA8|nr:MULTISPECIES: helix-turn-helix domain-containing protein [unclassified Arthrobacter]MBE0010475.1 ArsR family transcriptional regulator [Arthrobacter sp. AET 35A]NOJ62365.1 helix-turn-helix domain-containing protein [Arthrobacter sp. 147(2020)]
MTVEAPGGTAVESARSGTAVAASTHSQTLSRGIRALEILAEASSPLSIAELSSRLGVHRSIAYRILRTLEDHSLVVRDAAGGVKAGPGLAVLARGVASDLQSAALPELTQLANTLGMTAFVVVLDQQECVTLVAVEPRHTGATVAQRPGTRHPVSAGAPGVAIQSALSEPAWERCAPGQPYRADARTAQRTGYAVSHDEVIDGVSSVAVPVRIPGEPPAAVAVVYIRSLHTPAELGARLLDCARIIEDQLR